MYANRIRLLVAEHLMSDLAKPAGCMPFSATTAAGGWKTHDAPRQTRWSEQYLPPEETNLVLRCRRACVRA